MIFSATTEYALRALAHLATLERGERMLARDLAEETGIPRQFLGKILHRLARLGVLDSAKGRGGGFRFERAPDEIRVAEMVEVFEGEDRMDRCILGIEGCTDETPCPMHAEWIVCRDQLAARIYALTMADLGRTLREKGAPPRGTPASADNGTASTVGAPLGTPPRPAPAPSTT